LFLSVGSFRTVSIGGDVEHIDFYPFISMLNFKMPNKIKVFILLIVVELAVNCRHFWT